MKENAEESNSIIETGEATGILPAYGGKGKPITVIATQKIRQTFDSTCIQQARNARSAPGVQDLVLNPDAHAGYGAPVGCVLTSPTHIYPGPVGVDIKCSMSLLQLDIPQDQIKERPVRRELINALCERIPTGAGKGQRSVKKGRPVSEELGIEAVTEGASERVCRELGIPFEWTMRCEDSAHQGHDGGNDALKTKLDQILSASVFKNFDEKISQLGSYGGGNHFGECNVIKVADSEQARNAADVFGLKDDCISFLSHCGSRGFGNILASNQFKLLQKMFETWSIPLPAGDRELVYAPLGTPEADTYLDDMALGGNFATVNHLLINALVLEAFQQVFPGASGQLVYYISHNIAREEFIDSKKVWVHRKGATRAYPAGHFSLRETPFYETGHPILLPGNPRDGSVVMAAQEGADKSCYSVNHGAGRQLGRKQAMRTLDQKQVDSEFDSHDILSNCRQYPMDEAPDAYKDFNEVLRSVEQAGLASTVARLQARFVIKDADKS